MASKIPNPLLDAINAAMKAAGQKTVKTASKSAAKTAKKAAGRPSVTAKKAAKKAAAPKAAAPTRAEKQIQNIMKHNPQFSKEQAAQVAGMSREQRRELNAALHRAKTEAAAAEKKAGR